MPRLESPASVRRFLALAAAGSVVVLIYASLIPFDYTPLSWPDTWKHWQQIPWLNLQLYNRADWVANALVVLPAGFLAAAAVDWERKRRWPLLLAVPIITLFLASVVVGIELAQVWFPTRTVSLNDIIAGYVGAVFGPLLWVLAGPEIENGVTRFLTLHHFEDRLFWLCLGYLVFIVVYSVLPLDLVVSRSEWQMRLAEGNIRLNPFRGEDATFHALKGMALGALRMAPVGLLLALTGRKSLNLWVLLLLPMALELVQLPIFSKYVTTIEVVGGWVGGPLGYLLGLNRSRFEPFFQRPSLWGLAWFSTLAITMTAFLFRHDQVLWDPPQISERFSAAWALPLVKYYFGSEYNALTNLLLKLAPFAVLGATAFGWQKTSVPHMATIIFWSTLTTVLFVAPAIEILQVILPPLMPDISDVFTYWLGYLAGYQVMRILWGSVSVQTDARRLKSQFSAVR